MRRKVIQDFANVFCQHLIQLPNGFDIASFVHYGSGKYELNILTGACSYNGGTIPKLNTCDEYRTWLLKQLDKHLIQLQSIQAASLKVSVTVSQISVKPSFGNVFASAHFLFDCHSEIRTDEKSYVSSLSGEETWGFDWYYNQLYGNVLCLAD